MQEIFQKYEKVTFLPICLTSNQHETINYIHILHFVQDFGFEISKIWLQYLKFVPFTTKIIAGTQGVQMATFVIDEERSFNDKVVQDLTIDIQVGPVMLRFHGIVFPFVFSVLLAVCFFYNCLSPYSLVSVLLKYVLRS